MSCAWSGNEVGWGKGGGQILNAITHFARVGGKFAFIMK